MEKVLKVKAMTGGADGISLPRKTASEALSCLAEDEARKNKILAGFMSGKLGTR